MKKIISLVSLNKSVFKKKRLGRGQGSGTGGTSGKGHKGQHARSGGIKIAFEGGQTSIFLQTRKKGFNNKMFKNDILVKTTDDLHFILSRHPECLDLNKDFLIKNKLIKASQGFKVIKGRMLLPISKDVKVSADYISAGAKEFLASLGTKVIV
jgi:large subunit ribosomal protein L15